ncbi:MAG: glycosyltransferase family 39 protein [Planctomycetaceae bacterium]|nr:glycosyltransferase family 39 protein [Planctomycetaceae bacterium]
MFRFRPILFLVLLTLAVRGPIACLRHASLRDDRDHYRVLAGGIAQGRGLVHPDHGTPTAYRPPLYPLVLAGLDRIAAGDGKLAGRDEILAAFHWLLGLATVLGTWRLGLRLGLGQAAWWSAAAVAIDPLLVVGATLPMTETLFTALIVWLLATAAAPSTIRRSVVVGVLFGLAALCRPSVWAFGTLVLLACLFRWWRQRSGRPSSPRQAVLAVAIGIAVVVCPWLGRNLHVSGTPVLTTTHGGFTLLLGNNPVFYEQVVRKPLGTVWNDTTSDPDRTPQQWRKSLESRLPEPGRGIAAEGRRDTWMYHRALENISDDPRGFGRACLLRFVRFWTPWPWESAEPSVLKIPVACWYVLATLAMCRGLYRMPWREHPEWLPCLLLLLALSALHLVFWSTMRMRAPLVPVVALLAGVGILPRGRLIDTVQNTDL